MKQQFIVEYCSVEKFTVYGPGGTALDAEARQAGHDGAGSLSDGG